jgi:hypothetical protein
LTCDQITGSTNCRAADTGDTTAERLAIAIRLYIETIDDYDGRLVRSRSSRRGPRPTASPVSARVRRPA